MPKRCVVMTITWRAAYCLPQKALDVYHTFEASPLLLLVVGSGDETKALGRTPLSRDLYVPWRMACTIPSLPNVCARAWVGVQISVRSPGFGIVPRWARTPTPSVTLVIVYTLSIIISWPLMLWIGTVVLVNHGKSRLAIRVLNYCRPCVNARETSDWRHVNAPIKIGAFSCD
jgi:hypothetical protein